MEIDAASRHALQETDTASLRNYLQMGMIDQVGPKTADRILKVFGEDTAKAMLDPARLRSVSGIGKVRAATISESWRRDTDTGVRPTVMFLLSEFNLTFPQAKVLLSRYGIAAPDIVERNPYRLIDDIKGIGFLRADSIARRMGLPIDSPSRVKAALLHCLVNEAMNAGHTCLERLLCAKRLPNCCRSLVNFPRHWQHRQAHRRFSRRKQNKRTAIVSTTLRYRIG